MILKVCPVNTHASDREEICIAYYKNWTTHFKTSELYLVNIVVF